MKLVTTLGLIIVLASASIQAADPTTLETDLLIVGGNESACAAAVQAARLGVKKIVLVNDIDWLGVAMHGMKITLQSQYHSV